MLGQVWDLPDGFGLLLALAWAGGFGLTVGTNANTAAGLANVVTVGPPLTVSDDEISYIAETLRDSIVSRPAGGAAGG